MKNVNRIAGRLRALGKQSSPAPGAPREAPIDRQTKDALIYPFTPALPLGTLAPPQLPPAGSLVNLDNALRRILPFVSPPSPQPHPPGDSELMRYPCDSPASV